MYWVRTVLGPKCMYTNITIINTSTADADTRDIKNKDVYADKAVI